MKAGCRDGTGMLDEGKGRSGGDAQNQETRLGFVGRFLLVIVIRVGVLIGLTCFLSPIYATLTTSISPDTTIACIFGLLVLHMYLHDYGKSNRPDTKPTLWGSFGLACAMCASVLMSTRMGHLIDVISIVRLLQCCWFVFLPHLIACHPVQILLSLQIYIAAPYAQHDLSKLLPFGHVPSFLLTSTAALLSVAGQSVVITSWLLCFLMLIVFLCPMWLVRIQKFKANINGPWDEAVPKLNEELHDAFVGTTISSSME